MALTPFTPLALRAPFHFFFIGVCCAVFGAAYYFDRDITWVYWGGGLFLGAVGGLMQVWGVEEVIHSRKGAPSWKEFRRLLESTRWGKGYLVYLAGYLALVFYWNHHTQKGSSLENAMIDYLAFIAAKEIVTLKERVKLHKAYSFKEKRFEWAKLPRYRETRFRRFVRRWLKFF